MKDISVLDCTLRDGGRIIDCGFDNKSIKSICDDLKKSNIDIIEMGFIRSKREYKGNSTFFTRMEQIVPFIGKKEKNTQFVVFVDYGLYEESVITKRYENGIDGIRFGFTKKNYMEEKEQIKKEILSLKKKGYCLYLQDVNTMGYTDSELLELIEFVNEMNPVSFGIVDTYGAMDLEDLERIFSIVNHNLNKEIAIDFHSHNNMQLSFALAQECIKLCRDTRKLIVDATLNGMGKCAGNLNTELIVTYMNQKLHRNYDIDTLLDIIDEYLYDIKQENFWGYSIPAFMAGIYRAHPNNVIYLTDKFRLKTKDIKHILARIDEETRKSYNYDNIQNVYIEYSSKKVDDKEILNKLRKEWADQNILVLVPGDTINEYIDTIKEYAQQEKTIVLSVNYNGIPTVSVNYEFYGNIRRYEKCCKNSRSKRIVTSNISSVNKNDIVVNYFELIEDSGKYLDNTTVMLLNLLNRLDVEDVYMAGFDGFITGKKNYVDDTFYESRIQEDYDTVNKEMEKTLRKFKQHMNGKMKIKFITPSIYEKIF